jgi:hypothetical protein
MVLLTPLNLPCGDACILEPPGIAETDVTTWPRRSNIVDGFGKPTPRYDSFLSRKNGIRAEQCQCNYLVRSGFLPALST